MTLVLVICEATRKNVVRHTDILLFFSHVDFSEAIYIPQGLMRRRPLSFIQHFVPPSIRLYVYEPMYYERNRDTPKISWVFQFIMQKI